MFKKTTQQQKALGLLVLFLIAIFLLRVQLTKSLFFGFLLWNIFLATVPYIISEFIKLKKLSKSKTLIGLFLWLLFLPNAPYLITDFIHLHHLKSTLVWYDLLMLFCFAFTGLLIAMISINDVYFILKKNFDEKTSKNLLVLTFFLAGYGIYLGRFLRLNSWDLFMNPSKVMYQIIHSFSENTTWFFTLGFGSFLWVSFYVFTTFKIQKK